MSRRSALFGSAVAGAASVLPIPPSPAEQQPATATDPQSILSPFVEPPRKLTYAELGLPDDHRSAWEGEYFDTFGYLLFKLAEEAWDRTRGPLLDADAAEAELAFARNPEGWREHADLESANTNELFQMAEHACLVGWALGQTLQYSADYELWVQRAMARVGLRMISPAERRAAKDRTFAAYEELNRLKGRPVEPRPANWAEAPEGVS